jgi:hypothetical protein
MAAVRLNPLDGQLYCTRARLKDETAAVPVAGDAMDVDPPPSVVDALMGGPAPVGPHGLVLPLLEAHACDAPLLAVDLVGAMKRLAKRLYSRCAYCGVMCEALTVNMTGGGLSCGRHALPHDYPAWHRIWLHLGVPHPSRVPAPSSQGTTTLPCFMCRGMRNVPTRLVDVYDLEYTAATVPLCAWHMSNARGLLGMHGNAALLARQSPPPPVRLDQLVRALERAEGGPLVVSMD